ncbi:MAG TPA: BTAD domain-containing putative transcriptional regulator [Anaerolineae bacterium]|nr:BTAD domain-containing putative transcriptional regulator [Anaerolineae bacterium]
MARRQIQTSRYSVPAKPLDLLRRQRLLNFLHENIHRKLNLICATAGYGKSSLAIDFAHDTDYPVAWCRLNEADNDLAQLASSLTTALQVALPDSHLVLPQIAAQRGITPDELAAAWIHEIESALTDYFVLMLDDFHLIQDTPAVARFFDVVLVDLPEQAHFVIIGRVIPPLHFSSLAARQEIAGLSEEHLRFTPSEVQQLIAIRNGFQVSEAEAEQLIARTEGWITGILLTTHLMWQALMSNLMRAQQSENPLYDYLADEVFSQQPAVLQQFLLESAVLPEMEPHQCDTILDRTDSAQLLQLAEANRLFISVVGDETFVYQYHHLFRDFLLAKLGQLDPQRLKDLQYRTGKWYAANNMPEAAVTFYLLANQTESALRVVEHAAPAMFSAGRQATLQHWSEQLATHAHGAPWLHLFLATAKLDAGYLVEAEQTLAVALTGFERHTDHIGTVDAELLRALLLYRRGEYDRALAQARHSIERARAQQRIAATARGLRYAGLSHFALGQLQEAEDSLQKAIDLLQSASQLLQPTTQHYDLAWTLNDLAVVLYAQGHTVRATQAQQGSLAIWREHAVPGPLALALNNVGWHMHMLGQYRSALTVYAEALDWARRAGSLKWEATILTGQADIWADMNEPTTALDLYRQALTKAEHINDLDLIAYLYHGLARLDYGDRNYLSALEWLRRAKETSPQQSPLVSNEAWTGLILVDMGYLIEGRSLLEATCAELEQSGSRLLLSQALFFRAYAEFRVEEIETAVQSLRLAFTTAEQVGHDQMLVSTALHVQDMLKAVATQPIVGARATALLSRVAAMRATRPQTAREAISASTPPTFQIFALGAGRVLKQGVEISKTEWISQRTRELFFFLIDRAPIARNEILEAFWPDKPLARAVANLYQTLYRLRRVMGCDVVVLEDQACRLIPDFQFDYDVAHFEAQARYALSFPADNGQQLGQLALAAQSCTGEYLADLSTDWTLSRRDAINQLYVKVLREYAAALTRVTRYTEAREVLLKALTLEPFQDDLHEQMLLCLARLGRRHEVVDYYRRYRDTLRVELGLDPPPEIRALYARLID